MSLDSNCLYQKMKSARIVIGVQRSKTHTGRQDSSVHTNLHQNFTHCRTVETWRAGVKWINLNTLFFTCFFCVVTTLIEIVTYHAMSSKCYTPSGIMCTPHTIIVPPTTNQITPALLKLVANWTKAAVLHLPYQILPRVQNQQPSLR